MATKYSKQPENSRYCLRWQTWRTQDVDEDQQTVDHAGQVHCSRTQQLKEPAVRGPQHAGTVGQGLRQKSLGCLPMWIKSHFDQSDYPDHPDVSEQVDREILRQTSEHDHLDREVRREWRYDGPAFQEWTA